jgi:hypothetical protein
LKSLAALVCLAGAVAGCSSPAPAPAPRAGAGFSCARWLDLSPAEQTYGVTQLLVRSVPGSVDDDTRACLDHIRDWIADHTTELCKRDGGDFAPAAMTAIVKGVEFCQQLPPEDRKRLILREPSGSN